LISIEQEDRIRAIIQVENFNDIDYLNNHFLVMVTKQGIIKKTTLEQYSRPRTNGIIALNIREDDQLVNVSMTKPMPPSRRILIFPFRVLNFMVLGFKISNRFIFLKTHIPFLRESHQWWHTSISKHASFPFYRDRFPPKSF